ncbi:MAG: hypothetical protein ACFCBW_14330 [Candidatus Competibacterales bacterium]
MVQALELYAEQPYHGSRLLLLVSDGAASLDRHQRRYIADLLAHHRVALYWLYLRAPQGPTLQATVADPSPEQALHRFFRGLKTPYRAYAADNPQALAQAIAAVDRLQNLPLRYREGIPPLDWAPRCFALALIPALVITLGAWAERRPWR